MSRDFLEAIQMQVIRDGKMGQDGRILSLANFQLVFTSVIAFIVYISIHNIESCGKVCLS